MHNICASHWYQVSSIHHAFRHETKVETMQLLCFCFEEKGVCVCIVVTTKCSRIFFRSRANPGCWA